MMQEFGLVFLLPKTFPSVLSDTLPFLHHDHVIAWEIGVIAHSPKDSLILLHDGKVFEDFPLLSHDLAEYIRRGLSKQMIYLVGLTSGMRLYRLGELQKAFTVLNRLLNMLRPVLSQLAWPVRIFIEAGFMRHKINSRMP